MGKFKLTLFYIVTFGIGYFVLKNKAKKQATVTNEELIVTEKIPFDISTLIKAVGGLENIKDCSAKINSITFLLVDSENIDVKTIKQLGAKGTIIKEDGITCLFGDYSQALESEIKKNIKK